MAKDYPFLFNDPVSFENEKQTFSNLMDETVYLHGAECKYISISLNHIDNVFGEFNGKRIEDGIPIRLHVEQIDTDFYDESGGLYEKFGFLPNVGEATFNATINYFNEHGIDPKPQDLILYSKVNKMFEVTKVTELDGFKFELKAVLYDHDHREVADDVEDEHITALETLDDKDKANYNDPIDQQERDENVIDDSETDPRFG